MKINHAHAHAVVDRIDGFHRDELGEPFGFDMTLWFASRGVDGMLPEPMRYAAECRTSACLAGWAVTLLDSPEAAAQILATRWEATSTFGGVGDVFMDAAAGLLDADDEAREWLRDLFVKLSYTWADARDELLDIVDQCDDTSLVYE